VVKKPLTETEREFAFDHIELLRKALNKKDWAEVKDCIETLEWGFKQACEQIDYAYGQVWKRDEQIKILNQGIDYLLTHWRFDAEFERDVDSESQVMAAPKDRGRGQGESQGKDGQRESVGGDRSAD
jgi:hypothetical protein